MDLPGFLIRHQWRRLLLGSLPISITTAVLVILAGCGNPQLSSPGSQQGAFPPFLTPQAFKEIDIKVAVPTSTRTAALLTTPAPNAARFHTPESFLAEETMPVSPTVTQTLVHPTSASSLPPSATFALTAIPQPSTTSLPLPTAAAAVEPLLINGLAQESIVIMSDDTRENVREIYASGQELGRNPNAFSKLGDSVALTDHFLTRFDSGHYTLGSFKFLQETIDHYSGSFGRYGVATKVGLHAWSIFDPLWANKDWCLADEHMVACEIRLFNPSILLVKIGSNDNGAAAAFDQNVRKLVEYAINQGVIPVLATKADRFEGPDNRNNIMLHEIAAEYAIPLWDYDLVAGTLPRRGLSGDNVHMTMADADDYTDPVTFERGYPMSDLTALLTLHAILQEVSTGRDA